MNIFVNLIYMKKYILWVWSELLCETLQDDYWQVLYTQQIIKIAKLVFH